MLGYAKIYKDRIFAEGKAEGIAEGKAEAKAKAKAEGIAEYHRIVVEWNRRRLQAKKDGKEFTEPVPAPQDT